VSSVLTGQARSRAKRYLWRAEYINIRDRNPVVIRQLRRSSTRGAVHRASEIIQRVLGSQTLSASVIDLRQIV